MQNDTCYILALIKRDDGERLLLGSGFYEFTAGLKHFNPNLFANDVVELQGTDGQLLAGQVRRSTSQVFEGIIGDGTTSKQMVEQKRREFFLFFRKQHHYTVVYIMPDGTAIKRDRGYITEAPAVQELYQFQPKWRVALAFEDVNYYSYAEDDQGQEIYSFEATLALANIADGGLIWDNNGAISDAAGLKNIQIFGDTIQQGTPTTSSPIAIETVTGLQTISINGTDYPLDLGKNLFDNTGWRQGQYNNGVWADNLNTRATTPLLPIEPTTYTISLNSESLDTAFININYFDDSKNWLGNRSTLGLPAFGTVSREQTFTLPQGASYLAITIRPYGDDGVNIQGLTQSSLLMLEKGSTKTDYAPYKTPIELCKLGTFQDSIWKDGEEWKIHKATKKVVATGASSEIWRRNSVNAIGLWRFALEALDADVSSSRISCSDRFVSLGQSGDTYSSDGTRPELLTQGTFSGPVVYCRDDSAIGSLSVADFVTWLGTHRTTFYYALATATNTTITDADLIAQLEAIAEAMGTNGRPTAIVPSGQNLAAIITGELNGTGGYIFAPSSGGGPVVVTVNGVDNASPVWRVTGPSTNPTLTNSTTGQSLVWNGTVPADQTLVIDMGAQTATLEGANVFEFVSGSWVQLEPGQNRISYTAGNATRSSIVQWNEVVG